MLTDEQVKVECRDVFAGDVVVMLQVIARLVEKGAIRDTELSTVGDARTNLAGSLERATGINFDEKRAEQAAMMAEAQRQAMAAKQAEADSSDAASDEPAVESGDGE